MVICSICKKEFKGITNTHLKSHNITLSEYLLKYPDNPIRSEELKKRMYGEKHRKHCSLGQIKAYKKHPERKISHLSLTTRKKNSQRMKNNNPMKRKEIVKKMLLTREVRGVNKKTSERMKLLWKNGNIREKVMNGLLHNNGMKRPEVAMKSALGHNRHKSGIELFFDKVVNKFNLPLEYTGNNKIWIGYKNPDYKMKNKNLVIEVSSDAYHRGENNFQWEKDRIKHFVDNKYQCIIFRKSYCGKYSEYTLINNLGKLLNKILYENESYQIYHNKEGDIKSIRF